MNPLIHCPIPFNRLSRVEFDELSHQIMIHAFASQNELGRLCDEQVYQNDIALRLRDAGLGPIETEVPVTVCLRDFNKSYFLDLVVQNSFICELKASGTLKKQYDAQLLNYLILTDQKHGKLINLRPAKVEYRTVNAVVPQEARFDYNIDGCRFLPRTARCEQLLVLLREILAAWGAYLDSHLYEDALIYFLGGESQVLKRLPLSRKGHFLGTQLLTLLSENIAFKITSLPSITLPTYEAHMQRLIELTPFEAIHWINLHHREVCLVSIIGRTKK